MKKYLTNNEINLKNTNKVDRIIKKMFKTLRKISKKLK